MLKVHEMVDLVGPIVDGDQNRCEAEKAQMR